MILHVGLPKTGSTTLQRALFLKHPEVHYLGKIVQQNSVVMGCRDEETYSILRPLIWEGNKSGNLEHIKDKFTKHLLPCIQSGKTLVGSWESLANIPPVQFYRMADRIKHVFGDCRIIFVLRNPFKQLPSEYLQDMRGSFIKQDIHKFRIKTYCTIETWFNRRTKPKSKAPLLNYNECIQEAVKLLGKDKVGVFLFEQLFENSDQYFKTLCLFMGIDETLGVALTQDKHFHHRFLMGQLDCIINENSSYYKMLRHRLRSRKKRRILFKKNAFGPKAEAKLPPHLNKIVADRTVEGHRWLVERYQLPLEKYGYPL